MIELNLHWPGLILQIFVMLLHTSTYELIAQDEHLIDDGKFVLDNKDLATEIKLDLDIFSPYLEIQRPFSYDSDFHKHLGARLDMDRLAIRKYTNKTHVFEQANSTAAPTEIPKPWDMLDLSLHRYSSNTAPSFDFSWTLGLMDQVELDGGIGIADEYDCTDCLTFTYRKNNSSAFIRRVIDDDGEDYYMSDRRMKENIQDVPSILDKVNRLRPKRYQYIRTDDMAGKQRYGLLAQEVIEIFPELVVKVKQPDPDLETYMLNYDGLIPLLIKSIQEQQIQIESLQKQIRQIQG